MNWKAYAVFGLVMFGCGMFWGWQLSERQVQPPVAEPPAKQVRQNDGSLLLERKPSDQLGGDVQLPAVVPKGAVVERVVRVVVQPKREEPDLSDEALLKDYREFTAAHPCPDVRVDLALVKMPDDTRRVVASSPDGTVLSGLDVPTLPAQPQRVPLANAVGLAFTVPSRALGLFYDRDVGPFRAGLQITTPVADGRAFTAVELGARFGVRF